MTGKRLDKNRARSEARKRIPEEVHQQASALARRLMGVKPAAPAPPSEPVRRGRPSV